MNTSANFISYGSAISSLHRLYLLFLQEAARWIKQSLVVVLCCILTSEGARLITLRLTFNEDVVSFEGGGALEIIFTAIWIMVFFGCMPLFAAGSFSDLSRPAVRGNWLLQPARLWEKLFVRWFCSTVLFLFINGVALSARMMWTFYRYTPVEESSGELQWKALFIFGLCCCGVHAFCFFFSAIIKYRLIVMAIASFFLGFLMCIDACGGWSMSTILPYFMILWPLTWVVLKRSKA